jgi:hypothetical protein
MFKALVCSFELSRFVVSPEESANERDLSEDRTMLA